MLKNISANKKVDRLFDQSPVLEAIKDILERVRILPLRT